MKSEVKVDVIVEIKNEMIENDTTSSIETITKDKNIEFMEINAKVSSTELNESEKAETPISLTNDKDKVKEVLDISKKISEETELLIFTPKINEDNVITEEKVSTTALSDKAEETPADELKAAEKATRVTRTPSQIRTRKPRQFENTLNTRVCF